MCLSILVAKISRVSQRRSLIRDAANELGYLKV